ncbi:hypothetical protein BGZ54_005826 [Gamsiella multidivaricata]|nr:hypothetical protein BGZ54_005826 [Gamsiella multidivaricata]
METGKRDESTVGIKLLLDERKLSKVFKDILDHILWQDQDPAVLSAENKIIGLVQSCLRADFVSLDQVAGRFSRFIWEKSFGVPVVLENNGMHTILLLIKELRVLEKSVKFAMSTTKASI